MKTFYEFLSDLDLLSRLWLIETYFSFDPAQYNQLFDDELSKISATSPEYQQAIERLRGFNWVGYIAKSLRNAGYRDQREVQERAHDLVARMLTGGLFTNYDEERHGPLDLRFKRAVANAVKNMVEKDRNRRRFIPTVPIGQEFEPGGITADDLPGRKTNDDSEAVYEGFRKLVKRACGDLGLGIFDARMDGQETKSLIGREDLGRPSKFVVKRVVGEIKALAREHAKLLGDSAFMWSVERAFQREAETFGKRRAAMAARKVR